MIKISFKEKTKGMIALFTAIITVAIMTIAFTEYQYNNFIHLSIAQNAGNELKAKYLAKSSLNFSILMLYLQKKFVNPINKQFKMNFQIWQQVPITGSLIGMFLKGGFGLFADSGEAGTESPNDDKEAKIEEKKAEETAKKTGNESTNTNGEENTGESVKFEKIFDFEGDFYSEITDENRKYSINHFVNKYKVETIRMNLLALFNQPEYKLFFEEQRENEQAISAEEVIAAMEDWIDADDERVGLFSGAEDDRYSYMKKPYKNRNIKFTSFEELFMVYGVDDDFMSIFGDSITIYGTNEININTCDEMILRSVIYGIVKDIPPAYMEPFSTSMNQLIAQIVEIRSYMPFGSEADFHTFLNSIEGIKVDNVLKKRFKLITESNIFKIVSYGNVGDVLKKITVVIDTNNLDNQFIYYKEE